ncbi:MAG: hypothetical protein QW666_03305 [Candidatus Woesearchaeota archaeon]
MISEESLEKEFDLGKARVLLYYLGRSKKKLEEREFARRKLETKIKQLKKISTESVKKHVEELERHIADALRKEKGILTAQMNEENEHKSIAEKIELLEKKLGRYLETREARQRRIKELEAKIKAQTGTKREEISDIAHQIRSLEKIYNEAKKNKKFPKARLSAVKRKIEILKEKLKVQK